jgi:tRNA pseudouridine55 synthase
MITTMIQQLMIMTTPLPKESAKGILLIDKPKGRTSFSLVGALRRALGVKTIGHAGTLDPFATGVMVLLVGREYTRLSDSFLSNDKEYIAEVFLGKATDSHDCEGAITFESDVIPSIEEIQQVIQSYFQGEIDQIPPMFSAKKVNGKKLYELARKGKEVERKAAKVRVETHFLSYQYPYLHLRISCSKGTYIRSIAEELGRHLMCGAHLTNLQRTRSGQFHLADCVDGTLIGSSDINLIERLLQ